MAEADAAELADAAKMYWAAEGYSEGGVIREIDYSTQQGGVHPLFKGIKIVDCDTHITEAPDMFVKRAPASFKDRVPVMKLDPDGVDRWYIGERNCGTQGGAVIRHDQNKLLGRLAFPTVDEGHSSAYQMKPRLKMMDEMGIYAQIAFQNSGITQPATLRALGDNEAAVMTLRIYNDVCAEYQEESGQRIFSMAHLPYWDRDAMIAEAHRCVDLGLKGFVLPDKPEMIKVPGYANDWWAPILELCNDTGMPINFHINMSIDPNQVIWEGFPFQEKLTIYPVMASLGCAATIGNWMVSGLLDRYPKLKIGLIEAGLGWVPFVLEMYEHQWNEMLPGHSSKFSRRPREYFRDHFWTTFWFEKNGPQTQLDFVGADKVLFETDFPHPTCIYPDVQSRLADVLGGLPFDVRKKLLQDNAATLYNLPF